MFLPSTSGVYQHFWQITDEPILGGNERDRIFSGYLMPRNRSFAHEAVMVHRCSQTMAKLVNITPITRTYFIDMGLVQQCMELVFLG